MANLIPVDPSKGFYSEKVTLSGVVFTLEFRWNDRQQRWMLTLLSATGTTILQGIPVVQGFPILRQFRYLGPVLPTWDIIALDMTGQDMEPDQVNFGKDVLLYYTGN